MTYLVPTVDMTFFRLTMELHLFSPPFSKFFFKFLPFPGMYSFWFFSFVNSFDFQNIHLFDILCQIFTFTLLDP